MKTPNIYRAELTWGIYSRVATQLKLAKNGRSHVSRVANGERVSKRVSDALRREAERIDRLVKRYEAKHPERSQLERAA